MIITTVRSGSRGPPNKYSDADFSLARFHFCQPEAGPQKQPESLGSILWGDRIFNSPFEINMLEKLVKSIHNAKYRFLPLNSVQRPFSTTCKPLCKAVVPAEDARFINSVGQLRRRTCAADA